MTELALLQRRLQRAILGESDSAWPGLEVYRNAYRLRLVEALEAEYPMLVRWLGTERFSRMAWEYIRAFPSRYRSIRWIGTHLPEFLRRRGEDAQKELATFEWALSLAFDSADAIPLAPEDLTQVPPQRWPALRLRFHASVRLHRFHYPVPQIWKALQGNTELPDCACHPEGQDWLIWRQELRCFFRSLSPAEAQALRILKEGETFSTVCTRLNGFQLDCDVAQQMAQWLRRWLQEGLIVGIR